MATNVPPIQSIIESVIKDSSNRLNAELRKATDVFPEQTMQSWSRPMLVRAVTALRLHSGQTTSVKAFLADFKAEEVELIDLGEIGGDSRPQTPGLSATQQFFPSGVDFATLITSMQAQAQAQIQAAAERTEKLILAQQEQAKQERAAQEQARQELALQLAAQHAAQQQLVATQLAFQQAAQQEQMQSVLQLFAEKQSSELKLREEQLKLSYKNASDKELENSKFENRLSRASKITKNLLYAMPSDNDPTDIVCYIQDVEAMFERNKIDHDLRISLIAPHLNTASRKLLKNLPDANDFAKFKTAILQNYRCTPSYYRQSFDTVQRTNSESFTQFVTRLKSILMFYLESRNTSSLDAFIDLTLLDRLRKVLSPREKFFLSERELNSPALSSTQAADILDAFESEHGRFNPNPFKGQSNSAGQHNAAGQSNSAGRSNFTPSGNGGKENQTQSFVKADKSKITCTKCLRTGHLAQNCYAKTVLNESTSKPANMQHKQGNAQHKPQQKQLRQIKAKGKKQKARRVTVVDQNEFEITDEFNTSVEQQPIQVNRVAKLPVRSALLADTDGPSPFAVFPFAEAKTPTGDNHQDIDETRLGPPRPAPGLSDLLIKLDFGNGPHPFLVDSGAEITVVKPGVLPKSAVPGSKVSLQSAFGQTQRANLYSAPARIASAVNCSKPVLLAVACTDRLSGDNLLSLSDYHTLTDASTKQVRPSAWISGTPFLYENPDETDDANARRRAEVRATRTQHNTDLISLSLDPTDLLDGLGINENSQPDFLKIQQSDQSLFKYWHEARNNENSDFFIENNLLMHKATVNGFKVKQLVVPTERRAQIVKLAHDSIWSAHFAAGKTAKRIQAHFFWPKLQRDVDLHVHSCSACQKKAPRTKRDKVPITAVERPLQAFAHCEADLIGPIEPKSSAGHSYVLTFICLSTKWAEAVPLKTLKAEETCNALLQIFTRTSIPRLLQTDNGTNFCAASTLSMLQKLGIEVRHSTPGHPQAQGAIERWNAVLKRMLHHVVTSAKPRSWAEKLPYLLFAYRELPHRTTGIPPYQMVYGNAARGPLAALRDSWTGSKLDQKLSKSAAEYLNLLKEDLELVQKAAQDNTLVAQDSYVSYYNQYAASKTFSIGDEVLVLQPTSSNKLLTQWEGVGTIVAIISPNSYRVSLPSGARKTLHANDLRPYTARVAILGVVFEDQAETDFGDIETCPPDCSPFEENLKKVDLSHLLPPQQAKLLKLLRKYHTVFNDAPGTCSLIEHEINTVPDFQPKAQRPYRIPHKLQQEVDKQIAQLLLDGKIRESNSPYAHPIVCVAKPSGEVRICADLRYINSGTIDDRYPMPRPDDLLIKMAPATFISTLDASQGYYQIKMADKDIFKTAFVTNNGCYEYLVMPFGAKGASMTYQRCVDQILRPKCAAFAHAYIDDTAIYTSGSFQQHLTHLEQVLVAFHDSGMTLKLSKCYFGKPRVKYIGHMVGSNERLPLEDKLKAIKVIEEPTSKKSLRSFLGLLSFYRCYVPGFAQHAAPLTDLTKNKVKNKIQFNDMERAAFNKLKDLLCSVTALQSPDYSKEFIIHTDASDIAIGASLSQYDDDMTTLRPLAFASKKLSDTQRRWAAAERECYATVYALQAWDVFIFGYNIVLYTDSSPLSFIASSSTISSKMCRWSLILQRYNITVKHISGAQNIVADCLSRAYNT